MSDLLQFNFAELFLIHGKNGGTHYRERTQAPNPPRPHHDYIQYNVATRLSENFNSEVLAEIEQNLINVPTEFGLTCAEQQTSVPPQDVFSVHGMSVVQKDIEDDLADRGHPIKGKDPTPIIIQMWFNQKDMVRLIKALQEKTGIANDDVGLIQSLKTLKGDHVAKNRPMFEAFSIDLG